MLVVMDAGARPEQIEAVVRHIEKLGLKAHPIPGANRTAIGITGQQQRPADPEVLENFPGVKEVIRVSQPYKLVSREAKPDDTIVNVGGVEVGGKGLGEKGLEYLARVREEFDLPIITEAIDHESLQLVEKYADCIQIGARNMQNFSLLKSAGRSRKPVLLKRGMSATLEELLLSAEYIMAEGNYNVMLCERGVRTFADHTRNTVDLSVVPAIKRISHLPILVDPSHGTGKRNKVLPMSRAAIAIGADGVLIEVHHKPEEALSDEHA